MIPSIIDGFEVKKELGSGVVGKAYLAFYNQKHCIFKVLEEVSYLPLAEEWREKLASLQPPQSLLYIKVRMSGEGVPYLARQYGEGQDLASYLQEKGKLTEEEAWKLFTKILEALLPLHQAGIPHGSLRPENIILTPIQEVLLADVALTEVVREINPEGFLVYAYGKVIGRNVIPPYRYFSPDRMEGRPATCQDDIFSLGVVLYQLFTGEVPLENAPSQFSGKLERSLEKILMNMVGDVHFRYPNAQALWEELKKLPSHPIFSTSNLSLEKVSHFHETTRLSYSSLAEELENSEQEEILQKVTTETAPKETEPPEIEKLEETIEAEGTIETPEIDEEEIIEEVEELPLLDTFSHLMEDEPETQGETIAEKTETETTEKESSELEEDLEPVLPEEWEEGDPSLDLGITDDVELEELEVIPPVPETPLQEEIEEEEEMEEIEEEEIEEELTIPLEEEEEEEEFFAPLKKGELPEETVELEEPIEPEEEEEEELEPLSQEEALALLEEIRKRKEAEKTSQTEKTSFVEAEGKGNCTVLVTGISRNPKKKQKAAELLVKVRGISFEEAQKMVESPFIKVLIDVPEDKARECVKIFEQAKIGARIKKKSS